MPLGLLLMRTLSRKHSRVAHGLSPGFSNTSRHNSSLWCVRVTCTQAPFPLATELKGPDSGIRLGFESCLCDLKQGTASLSSSFMIYKMEITLIPFAQAFYDN